MTEWTERSIEELCERITSGGTPSRKRPEFFAESGGGIPWVKSQELVGKRIAETGEHISEAGLKGSSAKLLPRDTVLLAMYGATVGQLGYLDIEATVNQAICAMVTEPTKTDARFLYYALMHARDGLVSKAHGAAQQNLSQQLIKSYTLRVPKLEIQTRISAALTALDDLIENNRRRVEVLEEMARAIYREWFVHFRFPGHEDATFVDSDLGPIPEGWAVQPLGELTVNLDRHRRPLSRAKRGERPGPFPYYGAARLIDWVDGWLFEGEHLLFAEDGSVQTSEGYPVLQLVDEQFWANNHTHILKGDGVSTRFLHFACGLTPISGYVTGAAQPKITQGNLNRIPVVVGTEDVHREFEAVINPLMDQRRELDRSIAPLVKIRDMLLPKLVTGKIDVSDLDLDAVVAEAAV